MLPMPAINGESLSGDGSMKFVLWGISFQNLVQLGSTSPEPTKLWALSFILLVWSVVPKLWEKFSFPRQGLLQKSIGCVILQAILTIVSDTLYPEIADSENHGRGYDHLSALRLENFLEFGCFSEPYCWRWRVMVVLKYMAWISKNMPHFELANLDLMHLYFDFVAGVTVTWFCMFSIKLFGGFSCELICCMFQKKRRTSLLPSV